MVVVVAAFAWPGMDPVAGALAWLACGLLLPDLTVRSRWQSGLLVAVGGSGLAWGAAQGNAPAWETAVAGNSGLIALLIGVSFLQLVALPRSGGTELPRGPHAFRNTQIGVHLFGAVINLSTVFIVGDRLARGGPPQREHVVLLTRSFAAAAFWSPFFAAMAAALAFAPEAQLGHLLAAGLPLAAASLIGTYWTLGRRVPPDLPGYPVRYDSLRLPAVLATAVLALHWLYADIPVLALITLLAPTVTVAMLIPQGGAGRRALKRQVHEGLPRMGNELALFLGAGVLAAGLASVLQVTGSWVPFSTFGAWQAWLTLVAIIGLAIIGVHPVISIAVMATVMAPLDPHPSLLAATFLAGWGLGVCVSPLSGMNLALQGRYGIDGLRIARWNLPYTGWMLIVAAATLGGLATWLNGA